MEGRTLDPVYDFSDDEDIHKGPKSKKARLAKRSKNVRIEKHHVERETVVDPNTENTPDTEPYSLETDTRSKTRPNVEVDHQISQEDEVEDELESVGDVQSQRREYAGSSRSLKSTFKRIVSVAKDAENIAAMLGVGDTESIYERVKQLRNRSNRTDIVTNEILENGIEGLKRIIERDLNTPTQQVKDDGDDLFDEIDTIKASVLEVHPHASINPNEIYPLLEKYVNNSDRIKIVTDILVKNIVQSNVNAESMFPPSLDEQETPEIISEEDELVGDLELVLKHYPQADPDYVFKLITKHINAENRREKVLDILQMEADHIKGNCVEVIYDSELKNDPLFRETTTLSALFPNRDKNEIYAYLEAHYHTRNRVQVVTEELLRMEQGSQDDNQRYDASNDTYSMLYGQTQRYNGKNQLMPNSLLPNNATHQPKRNKNATIGAIKLDNSQRKHCNAIRADHCQREVELLLAVFPDCDPNFLFERLEAMETDPQRVQWLSEEMFANSSYPKLKDRIERERVEKRLQKLQDDNLDVRQFLAMFPDPQKMFLDESRRVGSAYKAMSLVQLQRDFQIGNRDFIEERLKKHNGHYLPTKKDLAALLKCPDNAIQHEPFRDLPGQFYEMLASPVGEFFFMELLFAKNEHKILDFLNKQQEDKVLRLKEATEKDELLGCQCCCQDDVLPEDMRSCPENHRFCVDCVKKLAETNMTVAKIKFLCMNEQCSAEFSLDVLRELLPPAQFSLLLQRLQEDEIRRADIKDLVSCPFCSFATIMSDQNDRVFKCLNPDCFRESCRLCQEPNHVPLRCDEVLKRGAGDMKTYIESKMTEAMIRMCWRCHKRFFITDGCNKATCSCGATMCYQCREPISSYAHFNQGRCGLYLDVMELHLMEMRQAAVRARAHWEREHPDDVGKKVDCDPTDMLRNKVIRRKKQKPPPSIKQRLLNLIPPMFRRHKAEVPPDDSEEDYEEVEINPLAEYYAENAQTDIEDPLTQTEEDIPEPEFQRAVQKFEANQKEKT